MKRYIYIFMAMVLALSCGKEPEPVEPPVSEGRVTLQVTSDSRQLESAEDGLSGSVKFKTRGGSLTLDVLTNQDEWTYETEGADWLDIESDDYFLILDAERNTSDALRTATVRIFWFPLRQIWIWRAEGFRAFPFSAAALKETVIPSGV